MTSFVIILLLFNAIQPAQSVSSTQNSAAIMDQTKTQARNYVDLASDLNAADRDLALWALADLTRANDTIEEYLVNYLKRSGLSDNSVFTPFLDTTLTYRELLRELAVKTGSGNLLIAHLTQYADVEEINSRKSELLRSNNFDMGESIAFKQIIDNYATRDSISVDLLPVDDFQLIHFLLFSEPASIRKKIVTQKYIKSFIDHWYTKSYPYYEEDSLRSIMITYTLLRALYEVYDYAKINDIFEPVKADQWFPNSVAKLTSMKFLQYSMYPIGLFHKSLDLIRNNALPLAKFTRSRSDEIYFTRMQAFYLIKIGKFQAAKEIYFKVLELAENNNIDLPKSIVYTNIGTAYLKTGEYDKFQEYQLKALNIAKDNGDYERQVQILNNLYIVERRNKNRELTGFYLRELENLVESQSDEENLASVFISMGEYYRDINSNLKEAERFLNKADSILNAENYYPRYVTLLFEKAFLYEKEKNFDRALLKYEEIRNLTSGKDDQFNYLDATIDKIRIHLKKGQISKADHLITELQNSDLSILDFEYFVKSQNVIAEYLAKTGNSDQAIELLEQTVEQITERSRNNTDLQSGYWYVQPSYMDAFNIYVELVIERGNYDKAVLALDKLKTINDASLYQNPIVKSSLLNEQELTQYQNLTRKIDELRQKQLSASKEEKLELESQIDLWQAQKNALNRKLTRLDNRSEINLRSIQRSLDGKEMILHISELNDTYYIASITRRDISIKKIPLTESLRSLFTESIAELAEGETNMQKLHKIYRKLHLSELPEYIQKVTVIPDSYLYQLPIELLPTQEPRYAYSYGQVRYLIEDFETHYMTSLSELTMPVTKTGEHSLDFIGFGKSSFDDITSKSLVPLPYAEKEVTSISDKLINLEKRKTFLNSESTEKVFRENAPGSKIIHLATHSEVSEQDPLFSTIYMSSEYQSSEEDFNGQIFAYELFEMNLSNELIMLNSCESGSGSYLQGSGIMGITRALRYAGAQSLVLNLWSVNDMMASEFAQQFYANLNEGKSKADAIRMAKLHFLKNKNANPHFWGPYMMLGSNEPVVKPYQDTNFIVAASFIFYLLSLVSISYVYQRRNNGKEKISP